MSLWLRSRGCPCFSLSIPAKTVRGQAAVAAMWGTAPRPVSDSQHIGATRRRAGPVGRLVRNAAFVMGRITLLGSTTATRSRSAAITASAVFALTLAIVAGLFFAWAFKTFVMNGKTVSTNGHTPATVKVTMAAVNLLDRTQILPSYVKTVSMTQEDYNALLEMPQYKGRTMLTGSQPINRTTVKPVLAETPIFKDDVEDLKYPVPVSTLLGNGKRAVQMDIPANQAMIQVGDRVDVVCTLGNDNLGSGGAATAILARGLRVIARFNTTRTAALPPPGSTRSYTLEATPYRAALIDLAKSIGASFNLSVNPRLVMEDGSAAVSESIPSDSPLEQTDRVTTADLARLFGISPRSRALAWEVETYRGLSKGRSFWFDGYSNGYRRTEQGATVPDTVRPNNSDLRPLGTGTAPTPPAGTPTSSQPSTNGSSEETGVAAAGSDVTTNLGFHAPGPAGPPGSCPTCGKKK